MEFEFVPFWRRITKLWFFPPKKPDGTNNYPSPENPPYYIDQTEDWKKMEGDLIKAKHHGNTVWPEEKQGHPLEMDDMMRYCITGSLRRPVGR